MIYQGGRSVVRLPQLSLQYLVNRRTALSSFDVERVPALYKVSQSQRLSDLVFKEKLRRPVLHRTYAQRAVSRPKAHTGRTTTAARKAPTTSKTKAAKKPAPRTTTPKAVPKAKSKAKSRIKPKPKPAKKKAKAKPKPKVKQPKVLTEKQKTALTIKRLKIAALKPPSGGHVNAWVMFVREKAKAASASGSSTDITRVAKEASAEYKQLTPERVEHYNHIANQAAIANAMAHRQWVESCTPAVIYQANLARRRLRRLGVRLNNLQDHRQVKGPRSAYIFFTSERIQTGDFKGLKGTEALRLIAREWKALPASEKKHFEDLAAQDKNRYTQEVKTVFNRDVRQTKAKA